MATWRGPSLTAVWVLAAVGGLAFMAVLDEAAAFLGGAVFALIVLYLLGHFLEWDAFRPRGEPRT